MKKTMLIIIFLPFITSAQHLSIDDMKISMRNTTGQTETMFKKNGFFALKLDKIESDPNELCKASTWVFSTEKYDKPIGYFTVGCGTHDKMKYCRYQTGSLNDFDFVFSSCKNNVNWKHAKKEIENGDTWDSFYTSAHTVTFITKKIPESEAQKYIVVMLYLPHLESQKKNR